MGSIVEVVLLVVVLVVVLLVVRRVVRLVVVNFLGFVFLDDILFLLTLPG